jgi:hypothetical protein
MGFAWDLKRNCIGPARDLQGTYNKGISIISIISIKNEHTRQIKYAQI